MGFNLGFKGLTIISKRWFSFNNSLVFSNQQVLYVSTSQTISDRTTVDWSEGQAFRQNGSPYNVPIDGYAAPKVAIKLIIRKLISRIGTLSFVWQIEGAF